MSKIPILNIGQRCPKSAKCPVRQNNECHHQGIKHKARYECHHLTKKRGGK